MHETLSRILASNSTDKDWKQAQLANSMAGLGLRGVANHFSAAYKVTVLDSRALIEQVLGKEAIPDMDVAIAHFSAAVGEAQPLSLVQLGR